MLSLPTKFFSMLKQVIGTGFLLLFLSACSGEEKAREGVSSDDVTNTASGLGQVKGDMPDIKFEEEVHDFGRITQGETVSFGFKFKNTGKANLIIASAAGSCGCTVPDWPKQPIKPGGEGKVDVVFKSEGRSGLQEKTVTVVTNCEPSTRQVRFKAEVIVPEAVKEEL